MRSRLVAACALSAVIAAAAPYPGESQDRRGTPQPPQAQQRRATDATSGFDIDKYFAEMIDDVSVYDPASPWVYPKDLWRRRVEQMFKIRQFLDLNQFHRSEVELGDMRIVTVYREIRRPEGSFAERLHGRITWVYMKQPNGAWWLWHDHTSEIPEEYSYEN